MGSEETLGKRAVGNPSARDAEGNRKRCSRVPEKFMQAFPEYVMVATVGHRESDGK